MAESEEQKGAVKESWPHKAARIILRFMDGVADFMLLLFILLLIGFGAFSIWDNNNVYQSAAPTLLETYKPDKEPYASFGELKAKNDDVKAWVTVYGTKIDYPIVHTEDNEKYINTNALGEFSLSGCPFLDCANSPDFTDISNIVYGHHMDRNMMFGDIDLFLERSFFESHKYGDLYDGKDHKGLRFFAIIRADAYDRTIYDTSVTEDEESEYVKHLKKSAEHTRDVDIKKGDRILLLSTCAGGLTNRRYILAAKICDETFEDPFITEEKGSKGVSFLLTLPKWWYAGAALLVLLLLILLFWYRKKHKQKKKESKDNFDEDTYRRPEGLEREGGEDPYEDSEK